MQKKGFTFVESLIAIILLFILLTGGMAFYFYSYQSERWSINRKIALELANSGLEELRNSPAAVPAATIEIANTTYTRNIQATDRLEMISGAIHNYREVIIEVTWQQVNRPGPERLNLITCLHVP